MEMPNKNGVLKILSHMVRPRNTHGKTRAIVMKETLNQLLSKEGVEDNIANTKKLSFIFQRGYLGLAFCKHCKAKPSSCQYRLFSESSGEIFSNVIT